MENTQQIKNIASYNTLYDADSIEWCPFLKNFFVCANYQLEEKKGNETNCNRIGSILLFSISKKELKLHQTLETAAILDQKWCPNLINNCVILGVVTALGTLEIYDFINEKLKFLTRIEINIEDKEILLLSLDWSNGKFETNEPKIVCSDSKGTIHLFKLYNNELYNVTSYKGHEFEAWIAAFDYWHPNIIFSGGDDNQFIKFDENSKTLIKNRVHDAGVTTIISNKNQEFILATGSYDSYIRLWDIRSFKIPINSIKMPDTVWRLKWDPFYHKYLLVACMWNGLHIVNYEKLEIIGSFYEHKNICYGVDWSYMNERDVFGITDNGNIIIGSCSFYDRLLCVSTLFLN